MPGALYGFIRKRGQEVRSALWVADGTVRVGAESVSMRATGCCR